jgi:hypothetical protein
MGALEALRRAGPRAGRRAYGPTDRLRTLSEERPSGVALASLGEI